MANETNVLEELFKENSKDYITYEKLVKYFAKLPNATSAKKIRDLMDKYKVELISSAEIAKKRNLEEAKNYKKKNKNYKIQVWKMNLI